MAMSGRGEKVTTKTVADLKEKIKKGAQVGHCCRFTR